MQISMTYYISQYDFIDLDLCLPVTGASYVHGIMCWDCKLEPVQNIMKVYGCSFVAKISWKKKFFFWKNICFLQNIHYLQKKIILYGKTILYWFFFNWKSFFYRKWKKYISHLRNIFLSRNYIFILQKKMFLIIKNIFVKTLRWTQ